MNSPVPAPNEMLDTMLWRALVFDYLHDGIIVTTTKGVITDWNVGAERMFGWRREEVLGKTPAILHRPEEALALTDSINASVLREGRWIGAVTFVRKDGSIGSCETLTVPLRTSSGQIFATVGVNRDITNRNQDAENLAAERLRLRTLLDAIPEPVFFKDREGRHVIINSAIRALFGVTDETHLGKTILEWPVAREHAESYSADDMLVMNTGEPVINREEPFLAADGHPGWFLTSKFPLRDADGKVSGLVGIARDITALRRTQEELTTVRQRLIDHVDNSPLAVIEWAPDGRVQHWAGQAERILGWSSAEACGRTLKELDIVHVDDRGVMEEKHRQLLEGKALRNVARIRNNTKDRRVVHCVWNNSILRDAAGQPVSILSLAADVTERILAEQAARDAEHATLAMERKLLQSQKLESLGLLAGGIAHDFNNMVAGVLGYCGLLSRSLPSDAPANEYAQRITSIATRASDLCCQMMTYAGRGQFRFGWLDLNAIIEETAKLVQISISKRVLLRFQLSETLPPVLGDASQLRQVIMNLVINGAQAIGENPGTVKISTGIAAAGIGDLDGDVIAPEWETSEYIYLNISDTGCGMSPEVKARIFDPFFTTKSTGHGLGLAAVLGIARSHGVLLRVMSEPGNGTTFRLLFPRADDVRESAELHSKVTPVRGKVLVADNEEFLRNVAGLIVTPLGFEVVPAADGRDALEKFSENASAFELIVLNLTIPRLDAEATIREFARIRPGTKMLLIGDSSGAEFASEIAGARICSFVQKPFQLAHFREKLKGALAIPASLEMR